MGWRFTIHAIVGLSLPRDAAFSGLALDNELSKHDAESWCGVQIIDLNSGDIVQWIRLQGPVTAMFDVRVLPGVRRPTATSYTDSEISQLLTIEIDGRTRHEGSPAPNRSGVRESKRSPL